MTQKTILVGNSFALTIPKESAKKLGVKDSSRFEASVDEQQGTITYRLIDVAHAPDQKVAKLTADFMRRYDADLRALAKR